MEDLRKVKAKNNLNRSILISKYLTILKINWWKILIGIGIGFTLLFPNIIGDFIGWWYNSFVTSLTNNIIK
jgi:hypothetical protein